MATIDQKFSVSELTTPVAEPISTSDVLANSRIDSTGESVLISGLISSARQWVEVATHRALVQRTFSLQLDRFPVGRRPIVLPNPPLMSVECVTYKDDADGSSTTISSSNLVVDNHSQPGRIGLVEDQTWPSVRNIIAAVTIEYSAGYGTADDVPQSLKQAMMMLVGHWFENREASLNGTVQNDVRYSVEALTHVHKLGDLY